MRNEVVRVGCCPQRYDKGPENPRARQGGSHASDNTPDGLARRTDGRVGSVPLVFRLFFSPLSPFLSFLFWFFFLPTAGQRYPRGRRGYRLLLLPLAGRSHGVSVSGTWRTKERVQSAATTAQFRVGCYAFGSKFPFVVLARAVCYRPLR
ncbi:hypothetical protein AVEN_15560-1 [Araneus ventricosus]|uniref:Uncharacterized protein n=1 Tax=Araneus ventricosus TaxID=182803 RepID=A0A4Y2FUV7_ARAVE|nr:hypothetical protein AVEN_15560-1 [Araneus ventricosus]